MFIFILLVVAGWKILVKEQSEVNPRKLKQQAALSINWQWA